MMEKTPRGSSVAHALELKMKRFCNDLLIGHESLK